MLNRLKVRFVVGVVCVSCLGLTGTAAAQIQYVGLGDSIGEGVQSADANQWTQPFGYHNLIALRLGANFPLPLIQSGPLALVGDTNLRSRLAPAIGGRGGGGNGRQIN